MQDLRHNLRMSCGGVRQVIGVLLALGLLALVGGQRPEQLGAQPCAPGAGQPPCPSGPGPAPITSVLPSCNPRILHSPFPGTVEASGAGVAATPLIQYTDTSGAPLPDSAGSIAWSFRAIVSESRGMPRVSHDIGGSINLDITTARGHRLSFRAHCIAGAGTFAIPGSPQGYVVLFADGITTGWPVNPSSPSRGTSARRTLVHFEAFQHPNGQIEVYVALVDGQDCALNFAVLLVTESHAIGGGTFSAPFQYSYTETNCALLGAQAPPSRVGPLALGRLRR